MKQASKQTSKQVLRQASRQASRASKNIYHEASLEARPNTSNQKKSMQAEVERVSSPKRTPKRHSAAKDFGVLFRWLISQRALFLPYHTVYLVTDNRDLQSDEVQNTPGLVHWPKVAAWWQERIRYVGPYRELTTVVFVHISADTELDRVHPTWAGTYVLNACVFLFPTINFGLIDSDCEPVTLFEVQELWWSSTDSSQPIELTEVEQTTDVGSLEHSHKRVRSVDTGRDTQEPGPPSKLSRSLSADNLGDAADAATSKPTSLTEQLAEEVDYGSSPERSPRRQATGRLAAQIAHPPDCTNPPLRRNGGCQRSPLCLCPKGSFWSVKPILKSMQD